MKETKEEEREKGDAKDEYTDKKTDIQGNKQIKKENNE